MKRVVLASCLGLALIPFALQAQTPAPAAGAPAAGGRAGGGIDVSSFARQLIEGRPLETRQQEKPDAKPAFAGQTRAPYIKGVEIQYTTIASGLSHPWAIAFLPDGRYLVTEKTGGMRIIDQKGNLGAPLQGVPPVAYNGQVGQLDVVLDRNFRSNRRIIFSYSELSGENQSLIALATARLDLAKNALTDVNVIWRGPPNVRTRHPNQGGKIALDPKDGSIFMSVGDRSLVTSTWEVAQKLDNPLGKIIHLTVDGKPHPSNPFLKQTGALPEIWSYGHRSEEGLTFDAQGRLWVIEHGARGGDEINIVEKGKNYGWPYVSYGIEYFGATLFSGITQRDDTVQPVYYWSPNIAPSGAVFYYGRMFPSWHGNLLISALRGQMVDRIIFNADRSRVAGEEHLLFDIRNRLRDVRVAPDGSIFVLTDGIASTNNPNAGKVIRVTPK
ncbi:MAG TPA: PQQ-dependent sugar dehydrogenase [Rhizomicrobium sp.]|nr:PQQ-dependent sugar dehydrogenase [Rhizomicrobium sp.]